MVAKEVRRKSSRSKALRRKNVKRKTLRRKNVKRKTLRRKNVGRKTLRRKNVGRKTLRRKNVKRKTLGGSGWWGRVRQCIIGKECGPHIGELSTSTGVNVLTVTDYEPPIEDMDYYYEDPIDDDNRYSETPNQGKLNRSAARRLAIIIAQIYYGGSSNNKWENLESALLYTTYNKKEYKTGKNYFVNKYLDAGLSDKEFTVLSLLATKLLRYFDVEIDVINKYGTSLNSNIEPKEILTVVYKRGHTILHRVGQRTSLDMKMKSQLEGGEEFKKGTAHMIAYLIYDYDTYGVNSDVSKFIKWVKTNKGLAEYNEWVQ